MKMYSRRFDRAWLSFAVCVGCAALLAACAPLPEAKKGSGAPKSLVYPAPPDVPRFIYERTIYGSADVLPQKADDTFKQMITGGGLESSEGFSKPYAVAVHRGRIFVSDSASRTVRVFDVPSERYFKIGDDERGAS